MIKRKQGGKQETICLDEKNKHRFHFLDTSCFLISKKAAFIAA